MFKFKYVLLMVMISLNSCVPAVIGGAAVGGKVMLQDKTVGEAISDNTIWTKIRAGFLREKIDSLLGTINIEVSEGRVLLTGSIDQSQDIIKILKLVWEQDGVKEVINEIKIKDKKDGSSAFDYAKDTWTTTQIKTKLLFTSDIRSANFTVETIDGVVYLFGIAKSEDELGVVKDIASSVSNAKQIVSYIRVRKNIESRIEDTQGDKSRVVQSTHANPNAKSPSTYESNEGDVEEDDIFDTEF